eukprot:6139564-Amphidinium_carterae.2
MKSSVLLLDLLLFLSSCLFELQGKPLFFSSLQGQLVHQVPHVFFVFLVSMSFRRNCFAPYAGASHCSLLGPPHSVQLSLERFFSLSHLA